MTRMGPSPLEWTVFFRIVDSCAEKSVSSAKSSSTYIVMGTDVGLHSRIDDDFLNKEEAAWNEHYPMAAFEFDPTPKEDWAKQVLYDHKPFDNTIHSGNRVISPRAYFALRNPTEGDMRKMLQNLSFEKQFLGEMNSLTNTQIKVNRRPSEGFATPAVPMAVMREVVGMPRTDRTMMMRKRRQSLRTKRKQPKIKTKGMGLQRDAALFLCNRKRAASGCAR